MLLGLAVRRALLERLLASVPEERPVRQEPLGLLLQEQQVLRAAPGVQELRSSGRAQPVRLSPADFARMPAASMQLRSRKELRELWATSA